MGDLALTRDPRMLGLMQEFAMHGDRRGRADILIHLDQLFLRRMAGDMDEFLLGGDDIDAALQQPALHMGDLDLVAGNRPGREYHRVAGVQTQLGMIVAGDPRERRARLALAARADEYDLVARQLAGLTSCQERLQIFQVPGFARRLDDPPQRAADDRDRPACRLGGQRDAFDPRDIG